MVRERDYQAGLIQRIKEILPGCFILKNDSGYYQGIPDLLVLYSDRWAMLEVKRSINALYEPNQQYYLNLFDKMSFSATIYPENEEEILDALQQTLGSPRQARLFEPK